MSIQKIKKKFKKKLRYETIIVFREKTIVSKVLGDN